MNVVLSWGELRRSSGVGIDRYVRAMSARRPAVYGADVDAMWAHILGAQGECVVAKLTDHYWIGDLGRPDGGACDVGPFHVRTAQRPTDSLILHEEDADDEPFVLVIPCRIPEFTVAGWCLARDGKRPEHWRTDTRHPAYFVPAAHLRPISELLEVTR